MKEKEGALLNHVVAGPQCQENTQRVYEKYDRIIDQSGCVEMNL
jgi:hypothetical protein